MRGAYARNWSLDDGGTEEKGRWLPISMRCWRAGPPTWSFVPAHQDTSTVATAGFISTPRFPTRERQKLGVAALELKRREGETDA